MYEPEFEIGQKVWLADTKRTPMQLDCPDCKGSKIWMAETANGEKIAIQCPRCTQTGILRDLRFPDLRVVKIETSVKELTISEARLEVVTADGAAFIYLCDETSSHGSGSFYYQGGTEHHGRKEVRGLYGEWDGAMEAAALMAGEQQDYEDQKTATQIVHDSSNHPFKAVLKERWWGTIYDAWAAAGERKGVLQEVLEKVKDLSDEMIEHIEDAIQDRYWRNKGPLERLVAAADAVVKIETESEPSTEILELDAALVKITPSDEVLYGEG